MARDNEIKFTGFADADEIKKREKERRLWKAYCNDIDNGPYEYLKEFLEVLPVKNGDGWMVVLHESQGGNPVILEKVQTKIEAERSMKALWIVIGKHLQQFTVGFVRSKVE